MGLDKKILGAVAAGLIAAGSADAQECGKDFDTDFGTSYTPAGGILDSGGIIPQEMTGAIGFKADFAQQTIEKLDGPTVTDVRQDIIDAIVSAGNTVNGLFLATCDYNAPTDDLIVWDVTNFTGNGSTYVINGFASGSPLSATQIQGFPNDCIDKDESTGRFFGNDGADTVDEFFTYKSSELFYQNNGSDVGGVKVNLAANEMIFVDSDAGSEITKVTGLSNQYPHAGAVEDPIGIYGGLVGYYPDQNGLILTTADDYLQYCDNGVALDTTPPDLISAQGVSGEGYFPEVIDLNDNPVVNCNDKEFVAVLAFNEDVTNVSASNTFGSIAAGIIVNGSTIIIPGDVNQYNVGTVDLHVDMEDLAGNPASYDGSYEVRCDDVPPAGYIEGNGDTYAIPGEPDNGRITIPEGAVVRLDDGAVDFSGDSAPGVLAEIQESLNDLVASLAEGQGELLIEGDEENHFGVGAVLGVGARTTETDPDCPAFKCLVLEAHEGTTVSGSYVDLNTGERVTFTDQTKVLVSQNATEGPGTGTGTGTGGETGTGTGSTKPGTAGNGGVEKTGCDTTAGAFPGGAAGAITLIAAAMRRKEDE